MLKRSICDVMDLFTNVYECAYFCVYTFLHKYRIPGTYLRFPIQVFYILKAACRVYTSQLIQANTLNLKTFLQSRISVVFLLIK